MLVALTVRAQYSGEVSVNAVVAPVTVRDDEGRIVSDVARNRFHLYVDGMEVPISDFAREADLPLSLAFIVDSSGSMAGRKLTACQDLVGAFRTALDRKREVTMRAARITAEEFEQYCRRFAISPKEVVAL